MDILTISSTQSARGYLTPAVAAQIRAARLSAGLGLREAARLIGVDPGYLSRLERALRRPSLPVAHAIVEILDLSDEIATRVYAESANATVTAYESHSPHGQQHPVDNTSMGRRS